MWRRLVAFLLDTVILAFLVTEGVAIYVAILGSAASGGGALALLVIVIIAVSVLPVARLGGSFGQLALGLQIARLDGRRMSLPHALVRQAAFIAFFPLGAAPGGFIGLLAAWVAGATGVAVLAALGAGALFGLLTWVSVPIMGNSLGLASHDAISRSIVVGKDEPRPFAVAIVPRSGNRPRTAWSGAGFFAVAAYVVAMSAVALPSTDDLTAGGAPAATDVVVSGTVYVPKGQPFSVTPMQPTTGGVSRRPPGLASLAASWCNGKACDVLANAHVRFVAPSRYGWQPLADAGLPKTADAQGSYRMILPQRYAASLTPTYVMATDPAERLAVLAEVVLADVVGRNQLRSGGGITLDVDHSTTYLALLRCPGGGTLGTCGSSAGDPSAEELEKAMAARFAEQGHAGYLQTPERTIEALVATPAVMAALEAGVRYGRVPPAAPAAIVAATRASPPLVAVTGPQSPQPSPTAPRPAPAVQSPARTTAPPAAVQTRPPVAAPAVPAVPAPAAAAPPPPTAAGRPPTVEPGCPSVYDGMYVGQATYQGFVTVLVNGAWRSVAEDRPRAVSLTVVFECTVVDVENRYVSLDVTAGAANDPYFGALGIVAASGYATLPLDLPQARAMALPGILIEFPNGSFVSLNNVAVPSFDGSRIASEQGTDLGWSSGGPAGLGARFGGGTLTRVEPLTWSLTKTTR